MPLVIEPLIGLGSLGACGPSRGPMVSSSSSPLGEDLNSNLKVYHHP